MQVLLKILVLDHLHLLLLMNQGLIEILKYHDYNSITSLKQDGKLITDTKHVISKLLANLDSSKAAGGDDLKLKCLKELAPIVC